MQPYVVTDFEDCNKQKYLVVLVVLPTGAMHYNTTNTDIAVGSTQDKMEIKIIWPHNMTDLTMLLSQFMNSWHGAIINMWKR